MVGDVDRLSSATAKGYGGRARSRLASGGRRSRIGCLLGHLLLLLLPLARLQIEESVDLLLLRLGIVEFQHVVVDRLGSPGRYSTDHRFRPRRVAGIDGHFPGDISGGATLSRASRRQSASDHRGRSRDDSGVVVIL